MDDSNWTLVKEVALVRKARGMNAGFTGKAAIYRWVGEKVPGGERIKAPAFAAVITDLVTTEGYSCVGHLGDAVKLAANLKMYRLGSAAHEYVDWGDPVGKPANCGLHGEGASVPVTRQVIILI